MLGRVFGLPACTTLAKSGTGALRTRAKGAGQKTRRKNLQSKSAAKNKNARVSKRPEAIRSVFLFSTKCYSVGRYSFPPSPSKMELYMAEYRLSFRSRNLMRAQTRGFRAKDDIEARQKRDDFIRSNGGTYIEGSLKIARASSWQTVPDSPPARPVSGPPMTGVTW